MNWAEILLSGLFTLLMVFMLTEWSYQHKKKQQMKSYALLLFFEVNDHLAWLQNFNPESIKLLLDTSDTEWNECKYFLATQIPYEKFSIIIKHYRSIRTARDVLATAQNPSALPDEFRKRYINNASSAHDVLFKLADLDINKLLAYNIGHKRKCPQNKKPLP